MTGLTERDPADMSRAELVNEWNEAWDRCYAHVFEDADEQAEVFDRRAALWNELRERTDAEPPACPECGERRWSQAAGEPKSCVGCDFHPGDRHEDLIHEIDQYWQQVQTVPGGETA